MTDRRASGSPAGKGRRYFAFLRAINTGGRRLTNEQVIAPFLELGLEDVAAYQAAGNITFRTDDLSSVRPDRLEVALAAAYGFDTPIFVRTLDELSTIVTASPFTEAQLRTTEGRIQVAFLQTAPADKTITEVEALIPVDDQLVVIERQFYWLPRSGISDSLLPVGAVERLFGSMTIRTLGTLSRMLARFGD